MTALENTAPRYLALDVLRGMTVALMIIVNSPGDWSAIYAPFRHAAWHGFTLTDLVFPTFLFVVGNAMSFSLRKLKDLSARQAIMKIGKRSLIIFSIGWLLNYFPFFDFAGDSTTLKPITEVRLFGVLQRIALCYFAAALLIYRWRDKLTLMLISLTILLAYYAILQFFGLNDDPFSLSNNAVTRSDNWLFNPNNLYQGFGIPFEPEGLLSTLPAVVNVIAGFIAGSFIIEKGNKRSTVFRLGFIAVVLLLAALALNPIFPINKPIWTSSYVIYSLGWDLLITALLITIIDLMQLRGWTFFFEVFGKNPLFIYILAWIILDLLYVIPINGVTLPSLFYKHILLAHFSDKSASFLFALTYMFMLWFIGFILDRRKIYVRV